MRRLFGVLMSGGLLACCSSPTYLGNDDTGFPKVADNPVGPEQAVELAGPHLEAVYALRRAGRDWSPPQDQIPPRVHVLQRGEWYHVVMDNYPYKHHGAHVKPTVRVHVKTGELRRPEQ